MSDPVFTSALAHRADRSGPSGLSVSLAEVSDRAMIDLRGSLDDATFKSAAKSVLGVELPATPRTSASKGEVTVLWMSTDQWLVTVPRDAGHALLKSLRDKLGSAFSLACDVSDARAIIRVSGERAREVLMKGTSVDMTAPDVAPGWVRRILFADVAAACHMSATKPDTFDVYVFRSNADYVWEWLLHTGRKGAELHLFAVQSPPAV
jgi:sarcosine oxidase subunit gamma